MLNHFLNEVQHWKIEKRIKLVILNAFFFFKDRILIDEFEINEIWLRKFILR